MVRQINNCMYKCLDPLISTSISMFACVLHINMSVTLNSWSGSHIRWGQPFRLRHLTTGHYLALTEDRGLVLQDREKSDTVATAFCFRASKASAHTQIQRLEHTEAYRMPLTPRCSSRWPHTCFNHTCSLNATEEASHRISSHPAQMGRPLFRLENHHLLFFFQGQWKLPELLDPRQRRHRG